MKTAHWLVEYSRKVNEELSISEVRFLENTAENALLGGVFEEAKTPPRTHFSPTSTTIHTPSSSRVVWIGR